MKALNRKLLKERSDLDLHCCPDLSVGKLSIMTSHVFLYLVEPSIVGCREPDQHDPTEFSSSGSTDSDQVHIQNHPSDRTDPNDVSLLQINPIAFVPYHEKTTTRKSF